MLDSFTLLNEIASTTKELKTSREKNEIPCRRRNLIYEHFGWSVEVWIFLHFPWQYLNLFFPLSFSVSNCKIRWCVVSVGTICVGLSIGKKTRECVTDYRGENWGHGSRPWNEDEREVAHQVDIPHRVSHTEKAGLNIYTNRKKRKRVQSIETQSRKCLEKEENVTTDQTHWTSSRQTV